MKRLREARQELASLGRDIANITPGAMSTLRENQQPPALSACYSRCLVEYEHFMQLQSKSSDDATSGARAYDSRVTGLPKVQGSRTQEDILDVFGAFDKN